MAKATVSTRDYTNKHGRRPVGTGWWIFEAANGDSFDATCSYSSAKRRAINWANASGYALVRLADYSVKK